MFDVLTKKLESDIFKPIYTVFLQVRISDINYGNHLGHDSLISLLHEARLQFLQSLGLNEIETDGIGIILTELVVSYKNEAFYGDNLVIGINFGQVKGSSFELIYQITQESGKLIARAATLMAYFDYKKRKVARAPAKFLNAFEACASKINF